MESFWDDLKRNKENVVQEFWDTIELLWEVFWKDKYLCLPWYQKMNTMQCNIVDLFDKKEYENKNLRYDIKYFQCCISDFVLFHEKFVHNINIFNDILSKNAKEDWIYDINRQAVFDILLQICKDEIVLDNWKIDKIESLIDDALEFWLIKKQQIKEVARHDLLVAIECDEILSEY